MNLAALRQYTKHILIPNDTTILRFQKQTKQILIFLKANLLQSLIHTLKY